MKKIKYQNYYTISLPQLWCDSVNDEEKIIGPCVSDGQLLTVYHVRIVAKSCEIICDHIKYNHS